MLEITILIFILLFCLLLEALLIYTAIRLHHVRKQLDLLSQFLDKGEQK